jgi:hypothetical protein
MNKVMAVYIAIYAVAIAITAYWIVYSERLIFSGLSLAVFLTPPFIVYLYRKKRK